MEREASRGVGTSDRERRERLERLQAELRDARARLAGSAESSEAAVAALESCVADAVARLKAERQRAAALQAKLGAAIAEMRELKARREEAEVLALGRSRRDRYVDWLPEDARGSGAPDASVFIAVVPLIAVAGLVIALMVNGCMR